MPTNFEMLQRTPSSLRRTLPLNTDLPSWVISPAHVTLASLAILLAFSASSTKWRLRYRALNWWSSQNYFQCFLGSPYLFSIKRIMSHHTAIFETVTFIFLPPSTLWSGCYVIIQTAPGSALKWVCPLIANHSGSLWAETAGFLSIVTPDGDLLLSGPGKRIILFVDSIL